MNRWQDADACVNRTLAEHGAEAEPFADYLARAVLSAERRSWLEARGWWGLPRVPERCRWPLTPPLPGCPARHIDLDAGDGTEAA